ncbi:hypothetical protein ACFLUT_00990 [Chloroflexota bacterium]
MNNITSRTLERRVFTSFLRDGSIEAFTGIFLLQLGLPILFSRSGHGDLQSALLAMVVALLLLTAVFVFRRFVVVPRLGDVKFLPERRRRLSRLIFVPTITLIASAVVGFALSRSPTTGSAFIGLVPYVLTTVIVFSAAAYFLDMGRLYLYAAIVGLTMPVGKYLETVIVSRDTLPATVLFVAFVFFGIATVFAIAFLRKYRTQGE